MGNGKGKKASEFKVPEFDESILNPVGDEIVRVVHTRPNQEVALESYCRREGIVCYLPVRRAIKVHNVIQKGIPYSYSREVLRPMFPSYIFIKRPASLMRAIHDSRLFARVVPIPYSTERLLREIRVVRTFEVLGFRQEIEVHSDIPSGGRFLITSGVWEGVEGHLVHKDGVDKWTVEIEFCSQQITTIIDPTQYRMIPLDD